ncbi:MAG: SDR family oxidoreductase [Planctomycetaceae bacterium]|nr:SDR family oxidoreductase [Planctomycetaceae bacterium]
MDQSILISGGSRGLGQAIAQALLEDGCRVATFSRKRTAFIDDALSQFGDRFFYEEVDALQSESLRQFVQDVNGRFGEINGLINNAAIAVDGVLALAHEEDLDRMLAINLKAALLLSKECTRLMLAQGSGNILNVSSVIALRGFSGLVGYAATKSGMVGMTQAMARELGSRKIRVNAIAPGYMETDMSNSLSPERKAQIVRRTPLERLGTAEDVVPWVKFLLSPASGFVTGQVIAIDGGASV